MFSLINLWGKTMTIVLYRINQTQNMHRFYRLDVQRDLFGQWCLMRQWGRIGRAGRSSITVYGSPDEANQSLNTIRSRKAKRGYVSARMSPEIPAFRESRFCDKIHHLDSANGANIKPTTGESAV